MTGIPSWEKIQNNSLGIIQGFARGTLNLKKKKLGESIDNRLPDLNKMRQTVARLPGTNDIDRHIRVKWGNNFS